MDKSKGEPVISVKTSTSKERVRTEESLYGKINLCVKTSDKQLFMPVVEGGFVYWEQFFFHF